MEALADAVEAGLTRAVGVSNFSPSQTIRAHAALARRGVPLASNQVEYSLLDRKPETSGLVEGLPRSGCDDHRLQPDREGDAHRQVHAR